jgi:choline dehydrogenase-like flavoprotein
MSLTELQHATLRALCDTAVPAVARADDPDGFWARTATDVGADAAMETALELLPAEQAAGVAALLDALAQQGFAELSQASREQVLMNISLASREGAFGIAGLIATILYFAYGVPDASGRNPSWVTFGYPGPIAAPPQEPKPITTLEPQDGETLEADVVIVGSGAGGGVVAGKLAAAGLDVVVLEMGGYYNESDYNQLELWAFQQLYWRGGPVPTADMNVTLQAGSCLGGGTEINWTNSLRTTPWVREEWARNGLADVTGPEFDRHLDEVWERLQVNDRCSELNSSHQAMKRGAERLGWSFATITRNWDPSRHDPATAGYLGFGDRSGAKQSTLRTYLADAAEHGARFIVRCTAERILIEDGRAAGVQARFADPDSGREAAVTVRAPQVVVAAGSLESPALLLRSGIGGPAAGCYLHLHPATATLGDYGEDMRGWWGPPQAGLINEFANVEEQHGFLIEGAQYTTGLGASAVTWTSGADHKRLLHDYAQFGTWVALIRDRGHGRVTLDANGMAVPWYTITDPLDLRMTALAVEQQVRGHVAAGARRVFTMAAGIPCWQAGDDVDAYIDRITRIPARAGGLRMFSAHQMGSCRMGSDPATSVADPRGELHDVPGVWIGDASAFPTASGTNPMISIMALASRTAENIARSAEGGRASAITTTEVSA